MRARSAKLHSAMADFSFSFDSDNPFAEPEAPKKAPASTDDSTPAPPSAPAVPDSAAPAATASAAAASEDDAFSLDSFDFAFDEGVSVNDTLPTQTMPPEAAPRKLTPGEAAFAEFNFNSPEETTETEAPTAEVADQTPGESAVEFEMPDFDAPAETEAKTEAGTTTIELETPDFDAPAAQATADEATADEAMVEFEMPDFEAPAETETQEAQEVTSEFEMPDFEASAEAPVTAVPAEAEADESAVEFAMPDFEAPVAQTSDETSTETAQGAFEMPDFEASDEPAQAESGAETAELPPVQEIVASTKATGKPARTDLEEFNALSLGFDVPDDEMFAPASETASETASDASNEDEVAVVADEESAESPREISVPDAVAAAASGAATPVAAALGADVAAEEEAEAEAEMRPRKPKVVPRVAILGASGIGKNHARWFHGNGCQVVGFLGSSADSTARTESDLTSEFSFEGTAYTDLGELLANQAPDIVCVATPPPLHFGHVLQCLEAGAHVLCEKPLVYAPTRKFRENRDGAKELVKVAAKKNLILGTQLQYGAATPILCKLAGLSPHDVGDFAMELETLNANSPRDPRELWIDLGPHPISVAQMLAGPQAQLAEETVRFEPYQDDDKTEVVVRFGINCADGRLLMVRAVVRALRGETKRKPRRRFSFNGHAVTYAPLQTSKGGFQAQFVAPDGYASVYPDPVNYLIGDFVRACVEARAPLISGDFGRENLEWMLKVATPGEAR